MRVKLMAKLSLALVMLMPGPALADDWQRMHSSRFPARVRSITFEGGKYAIEQGRRSCWGAWCVEFGAGSPIATYNWDPDIWNIHIRNLRCTNSVVGESECSMTLMRHRSGTIECHIPNQDKIQQINIRCPTDLKVE